MILISKHAVIHVLHCLKGNIMAAVSLRLPDEISTRLSNLAEKTGRSKTFYMIEAINEHIERLEDIYLTEQRTIDFRARKSQLNTGLKL